MSKYELKLMWTIVRNLLRRLPTRHPALHDLFRQGDELFVLGRYAEIWLQARSIRDEQPEWIPAELLGRLPGPLRWHGLAELECRALGTVKPSALRCRIDLIGELFELDPISLSLLEWLYFKDASSLAMELFRLVERVSTRAAVGLSIVSGHGVPAIERRLGASGQLQQFGLIEPPRYARMDQMPELARASYALLAQPLRTAADARSVLLGKSLTADLDWDDFRHLGESRMFAADLIHGALEQGEGGVSVLLFGAPGTGKTEFCKALARKVGSELYALGELDECGGMPNTADRLASVRMAQALLRDQGDALLLIDEAEDVLVGPDGLSRLLGFGAMGRQPPAARVFLHRLLENSPAPMLWICNDISSIDPAILRRFSYVLEVQPPSRQSRQRVWSRALAQQGYTDCESLAARCARLSVSPGIAAQAVRAARIAGHDLESVEHITRQLGRVVSGKPVPREDLDHWPLNVDLICCGQNIGELTERLIGLADRRFSLCVEGPPGTGKSAWVRYLAERLDMEVRLQRASDLLDMYVGGTEAKIARTFARAQAAGELLVFDEADSFLRDRRAARHSWELTAVNEMLTWMESHPLPFACTTNLLEAVDLAAMRRFTFKLRFEHLDLARVRMAFRYFFGFDWPSEVAPPACCVPGDFAVVAKRARIEGITEPVLLATMLVEECRYKSGVARGMGFLQAI